MSEHPVPPHHEGVKEFSRMLNKHWFEFLMFLKEDSLKNTSDSFLKQAKRNTSRKADVTVISSPYNTLENSARTQPLADFYQILTSTSPDISAKEIIDTYLLENTHTINLKGQTGHHISIHQAETIQPELMEFYTGLVQTTQSTEYAFHEWLSMNSREILHSQRDFVEILSGNDEIYTDFNTLRGIFNDNIRTILSSLQLLIGDARANDLDRIFETLHSVTTQKPEQTFNEQYPSLSIVGLLGKLGFGVLGTLSNKVGVLVMNQEQKNVENSLKMLTLLRKDNGTKHWGGCPSIAIIPETFRVFFEVMVNLYPDVYYLDSSKHLHRIKTRITSRKRI